MNADQLIDHIRKVNSEKGAEDCFEKQLEEIAQYFIQQDKENPSAYIEKCRKLITASPEAEESTMENDFPGVHAESTTGQTQI
ncbi:hypothetical protein V6615_00950 [Oscillospiraceae bacterium PP1C4]